MSVNNCFVTFCIDICRIEFYDVAMLDMARISKTFRLPQELLDRVSAWMKTQPVPPAETAVVEKALEEFLDKHGKKDDEKPS